jgi:Outer membrane protein beta-barrel domain
MILCSLLFVLPAHAQDASSPESGKVEAKKIDIHLSAYALGTLPMHASTLKVGGDEIPQTSVGRGIGGGFKAGIFPHVLKRIVGLEAETFILGAGVTAPRMMTGAGIRSADADFIAVTTMVNVLLRYPGQILQPYGGVGGGLSSGFLLDTDIQHGSDRITGNGGSMTFAYQFLGGLRGYVTPKVFLFGEYKYVAAKYDWDSIGSSGSRPSVTLNLHAQLFSIGIGLSF